MPPLPDFSNTSLFPDFSTCPLVESSTPPPDTTIYYLLGTVLEDMTLASNPTFVCRDRSNVSFAVTIKLSGNESFDNSRCKKGYTIVVKGARRWGVRDGKQGSIRTNVDHVEVIPTSGELLFELKEREVLGAASTNSEGEVCQGCGEKGQKVARCKGCESVWYCDKVCQKRGWIENGHKNECKVYKVAQVIFS